MAFRGRPQSYARPENALKRAEELENVGQKGSALQALHDIVTSKKHRTWSKTHESIMMKHLDLVVELKKRNYAKEALMQYRNMCQAVNINSLEEVIKYFLKKTSDKAEEAQNKAAVRGLRVVVQGTVASREECLLSLTDLPAPPLLFPCGCCCLSAGDPGTHMCVWATKRVWHPERTNLLAPVCALYACLHCMLPAVGSHTQHAGEAKQFHPSPYLLIITRFFHTGHCAGRGGPGAGCVAGGHHAQLCQWGQEQGEGPALAFLPRASDALLAYKHSSTQIECWLLMQLFFCPPRQGTPYTHKCQRQTHKLSPRLRNCCCCRIARTGSW